MALYRTVLPYRKIAIRLRPKKRNTKAKLLAERTARERAEIANWVAHRKDEGSPLAAPRMLRSKHDGRVVRAPGGTWVSKRALHDDFVAYSDIEMPWERFLNRFRDVRPSARLKRFNLYARTPQGTLIMRHSEVFAWYPDERGTNGLPRDPFTSMG